MIYNDKKLNDIFSYWLLVSLILVFTTIVIGGLTRLTNSGLSIIEWELFKGIIPPLSESDWEQYFASYKTIPQYELLNSQMNLNEFKIIFYWEYIHRLIARMIGLFFLIPLVYFYFFKKIEKKYLNPCLIIFGLIVSQGIIGWFMVKSGLINNVTVSHYRLSLHLSLALIIISIIFWVFLNKKNNTHKSFFSLKRQNFPILILLFLVFTQIIFGAFVSGLDAGKIYQTWPLMGSNYIPNDLSFEDLKNLINFENHSLVQFYHRNLAYLISIYILVLTFIILKSETKVSFTPIVLVNFFLIIQIFLGVTTLVSNLNIYLASAHQITSVLLVLSLINMYYNYIK